MSLGPQIISQSRIEEADYSAIKIIALALAGIAASVVAVYEIDQFLITFQYAFLWFGLAAFLIFFVVTILHTFFIKHFSIIWGIVFVETLLPLILFAPRISAQFSYALFAGFVVFLFFSITSIMQGRALLKNSVKIRFFQVAKAVTPKLVTGALILASVLFYTEYFEWKKLDSTMGKAIVYESVAGAEPIVHLWFKNVSGTQTVKEFLREITIMQIAKLPPDAIPGITLDVQKGLDQLQPEVKEKIIARFSEELKKTLETKIGPLDANMKVRDVAYTYVDEYVTKMPPGTKTIFSIGAAVLLFFSLKGIAVLFYWFINMWAFLMYKFLIAADFALLTFETRNREFVVLP
ncbi:MAG: hypothetical protein WCV80_00505 [Candidatus Paceibacterota bacterium]|jgi:hypothetical protein